jgi:hypothetical protein
MFSVINIKIIKTTKNHVFCSKQQKHKKSKKIEKMTKKRQKTTKNDRFWGGSKKGHFLGVSKILDPPKNPLFWPP